VYAYAKDLADAPVERYALALARHFVDDVEPVTAARVSVEEYAWERIEVDGEPHEHSFARLGQEVRTTTVTVGPDGTHVVSGLTDLVVLKSTGSEFTGFLVDELTTLQPTQDRVLATSLTVRWRYVGTDADVAGVRWDEAYSNIKALLLARFATVHSKALQQTLWEMGRAVLEARDDVAEVRLVAPNRHHFVVDLDPFGRENAGEVFHADDRPYGLITAVVERDEMPPAPEAWAEWPA
jgi:urate oxidase